MLVLYLMIRYLPVGNQVGVFYNITTPSISALSLLLFFSQRSSCHAVQSYEGQSYEFSGVMIMLLSLVRALGCSLVMLLDDHLAGSFILHKHSVLLFILIHFGKDK
jgi:hypothetical protein